MRKIKVLHIKQNGYLSSSESFVHARVLNPICQSPITLITDHLEPSYKNKTQMIKVYEVDKMNKLLKWINLKINYRTHWNIYYFLVILSVKPEIIHAHFSGAGEDSLLSAKMLKIPMVVNFYGIETNHHIHDLTMVKGIRKLYAKTDGLICSSNYMKSEMIKSGCPENKISVVRCGIDQKIFDGEPTKLDDSVKLSLISIARLHPEKGIEYLVEACSLLEKESIVDWELIIVGEGPSRESIEKLIRELGVESKIKILGHQNQSQIVDLLRKSHLHILASIKETQGVALIEAQATCTPVIASNVGGIPESLLDGETGFLVQPKYPYGIVEKIKYFMENPSEIDRMGKNGREFIINNFSRTSEYKQLAKLYDNLIANFKFKAN